MGKGATRSHRDHCLDCDQAFCGIEGGVSEVFAEARNLCRGDDAVADLWAGGKGGSSERAMAWEISANGCLKFAEDSGRPTLVLAQAVNDSQLKRVFTINDIGISKAAGWSTLSCLVALREDADLDLPALRRLLARVKKEIHQAPDAARYAMNQFVGSVGGYVVPLTGLAIKTAETIGAVTADLGKNACKVPDAAEYIRKMEKRGVLGKKRKTVKC